MTTLIFIALMLTLNGCDSKKITYKEASLIVDMAHSAFMAGVSCGHTHTNEECEKIEKEILTK